MGNGSRDDDSTGFTGKRRKTYRELDAQRGRSKYQSRQDDPGQQRIERSASYEKYKKAADAIFSGGALPEGLATTLDPEGKRAEQKEALKAIADCGDRKEWARLVLEFKERYPLPDDPFFLDSLLDHPKDSIVAAALTSIEALVREGRLTHGKGPRSLEQRLRSLEMTSLDTEIAARARALRAALG
jgi:hypothetical protein